MRSLLIFTLVGVGAQLVDGALGMAFGVTATTLLVLSGVADAAALLAAGPQQRPVYVALDVRVLRESVEQARIRPHPGWRVDTDRAGMVLHGNGTVEDPLDALRALCAVWWAGHAGPDQAGPAQVRAGDESAAAALHAVGLDPARA